MNCDHCSRTMSGNEDAGFRCKRCGATWNGVAGYPVRPGYNPTESAARFDAAHNPTPEQVAREVAAEQHARRWSAATNDANGDY